MLHKNFFLLRLRFMLRGSVIIQPAFAYRDNFWVLDQFFIKIIIKSFSVVIRMKPGGGIDAFAIFLGKLNGTLGHIFVRADIYHPNFSVQRATDNGVAIAVKRRKLSVSVNVY